MIKKNPLRFYVYAYLRSKDSKTAKAGTPYYIGKGQGSRAFNKHKNPIPKNKAHIVFLETNLSEIGAFALERRYIAWYGRKCESNGILNNLTLGGDGISGYIFSEETKDKIRNTLLGNCVTEETKDKISKSMIGEKNHMYGKKHSAEAKIKMSKPKGPLQPWSEERKKIASKNSKARCLLNPMKESTKALLRKPQEKVICPHCGKTGGFSVMKRHHFDRCKLKPKS